MSLAIKFDNDFFNVYSKEHSPKEVKGVPNFEMNIPLVEASVQGDVGLELEMEANSPLPSDGDLEKIMHKGSSWSSIRDGSLRGEFAREFVLARPCKIEGVRPMLEGLFKAIECKRSAVANSNRCSTHVHLNIQGLKINEITAFICLWTLFEDALIDWCGEERKSNHFTLSSKESQATLDAWESFLRYGQQPADRHLKYSALNVLPIWNLGSVEVRCGGAADDAEKPILWATFLHNLLQQAKDVYSNILSIGQDTSERGAFTMLQEVCSRSGDLEGFAEQVLGGKSIQEFNNTCLDSFRRCQSLAYGFPWEAWKELINRQYIPNPFSDKKPSRRARPRPPEVVFDHRPAVHVDRVRTVEAITVDHLSAVNRIREGLGFEPLSTGVYIEYCRQGRLLW